MAADMAGYSRLMEADQDGVIARQKRYLKTVISPAIADAGGTIVKTTGDGLLVEFPTAQSAVRCAVLIQKSMPDIDADAPENRKIQYRIGINIGDIVFDSGDIFGDGVNIAARLESIAEPGGVCVSDAVRQMLTEHDADGFSDLGTQKVKNISRPIRVWQWSPRKRTAAEPSSEELTQSVSFCIAPDGVQLAYASVGTGKPIFKGPNWLNHIEYDWRSPVWHPLLARMAAQHRLVRYDQRGNGLSDWDVDEISIDAMISDMETVVDASQLDRFAIFSISQGCAFSVRYAVQNPDRVSCLVLLSGYARGALKRQSEEQASLHRAGNTLIEQGWGSPNPAFRHLFTESIIADASPELKNNFDELQRLATSPKNAARINEMNANVDVTDLARQVKVPTLVLHMEGDRRVPLEEGRRLAALIPGAQFVTLPGNNHALVESSPSFDRFFEEFDRFMAANDWV